MIKGDVITTSPTLIFVIMVTFASIQASVDESEAN